MHDGVLRVEQDPVAKRHSLDFRRRIAGVPTGSDHPVGDGADIVLASARRYGLKVLFGIWVSNRPDKVQRQIASTVALAREYSDVIRAIVVGNEVLLRGEMSSPDLVATIREVKARVPQPVTYADVWEFWLRYPEVQSSVDFVTIHILPYWEDFPISAAHAAAHVGAIRRQVADLSMHCIGVLAPHSAPRRI